MTDSSFRLLGTVSYLKNMAELITYSLVDIDLASGLEAIAK